MEEFFAFVARHPFLFSGLAVVIVLIIANEVYGNVRGGKRLSPVEAVRLANDRGATFVDVRTPADFKRGHLIEAVNVPASKLDERVKSLDKSKDKPLIVYCALGGTAPTVVDRLRKLGFTEVYAMRGGIASWQNAGLPVSTKA